MMEELASDMQMFTDASPDNKDIVALNGDVNGRMLKAFDGS